MTSTARSNRSVGLLPLWFGLLAGHVAWTVQLLVSYALVPLVCATGLVILIHLVTLITAGVALAAAYVSWRSWQQTGLDGRLEGGGALARSAFMALAGVLLSGLFFILIVVGGLASFIVSPCG